jgi:hypothetical protein
VLPPDAEVRGMLFTNNRNVGRVQLTIGRNPLWYERTIIARKPFIDFDNELEATLRPHAIAECTRG